MKNYACLVMLLLLSWNCCAEPLRIGYIGALTGDSAAIGTEIERALEVAADLANAAGGINGRKIEIVAEDDGYDIKRALTAYQHLQSRINSRVIFVSTYGALFALGKRPENDDLLVVDTLDCNDDLIKISKLHLCVATRTESIGETFLAEINRQGGGTTGVLYEEEAWFNFIVATLQRGLGQTLVPVAVPVTASDYQTALLRLKAAKVQHLAFLGNDSMGRAMSQARQLGISAKFYSIAGVMSPGFQALAGAALEGTTVSSWRAASTETFERFSNAFITRWQTQIQLEFVARPTADAATLVFEALRTATATNSKVSAFVLARIVRDQAPFQGLSGRIKVDPDGAVRSIRETGFTFQAGKLIPIH